MTIFHLLQITTFFFHELSILIIKLRRNYLLNLNYKSVFEILIFINSNSRYDKNTYNVYHKC